MALSYQWKWQRGQRLTAKFNNGTTALGETFAPVILSSNLLELPTAGAELLGVVEANAGASETGLAVIVSDDIFQVQVKTGVNLALGDAVSVEADGSVDAAGTGESVCGHVVDYDPATGGIAHIKASFGGLRAALGGEEILAILAAETDSASGADKIGATPITGVGTANTDTVQEILEALVARLKAVTDSASGADLIGATVIATLGAAATVQAQLEAIMAQIGDVTQLETTDKTLVGALNEIHT